MGRLTQAAWTEMNKRRSNFFAWLEQNEHKIQYIRRGSSEALRNEYNLLQPNEPIKDKQQIALWVCKYREMKGLKASYPPHKSNGARVGT